MQFKHDLVLSKGMTADYKGLYKSFRRKDASSKAVLKYMGLNRKAGFTLYKNFVSTVKDKSRSGK